MSSTAATVSDWCRNDERNARVNAHRIVVMGVSGCGKSTVAQGLAQALQIHFGWLQQVAARLGNATTTGACGVVVSCSALKRSYRDLLRAAAPGLRLVFLHGPDDLLRERLATRVGHYMPASLLQSQLDALEPPGEDESPISLPITLPPADIVARAVQQLEATP